MDVWYPIYSLKRYSRCNINILASRLPYFIWYFIYFLALIVLSSITKKEEIVWKMDLNPFDYVILVFDDQRNIWTNVFANVYVYSPHDAKWLWTAALMKQHFKEDIRRLMKDLPTSSEVQDTRQEKPK
jgi:hypothetical protein